MVADGHCLFAQAARPPPLLPSLEAWLEVAFSLSSWPAMAGLLVEGTVCCSSEGPSVLEENTHTYILQII
jgi:hypothetical protein